MTSLQDRYFPDLPCFGCGPSNANGLRIKSHLGDGGLVVAEFTPWPEHDNGLGFLNGGIISTVLDCHSAGHDPRELRPRDHGDARKLARVAKGSGPEVVTEVWHEHDGKQRARATAVWKRWRPR